MVFTNLILSITIKSRKGDVKKPAERPVKTGGRS